MHEKEGELPYKHLTAKFYASEPIAGEVNHEIRLASYVN
jgi:hypothetical protein